MQKKRSKKRSMTTLMLCAVACAFSVLVFGPLEQFMLNQGDLWFNLEDIAPFSAVCFLAAAAALTAAGLLLPAKVRRAYTALVLGLTLCWYLQGNFINAEYGELDGRLIHWENYTGYAVWNTAFWLLLPLALMVFALKKAKAFRTVARTLAGALIVIQAVTLVSVFLTTPVQRKDTDWIVSDRGQFTLGAGQNTVVFVVDACDGTYLPRMQAEDPEALTALDGFTYFSDYAGSYSKTKMGLPYILTQRWYENDETVAHYLQRIYGGVPLYDTLRAAGWGVRIYTSETYVSDSLIGTADNVIAAQMTVSSTPKLFGKMMQFVSFRYLPHLLKPQAVFYSGDFGFYKAAKGADQPYFKDNFLYREKLAADGLSLQEGNFLTVYHINGSHLPCNMNAQGEYVGPWKTTALEQTKGVFRTIITPYLEQMKALGVYDSANIIITADHGRFDEGPVSPVMLLKPAGAHGEMQTNAAMASVSDLHATLLKLCGFEAEGEAIYELPEGEERVRRYLYYPTTKSNGGTLPALTEYHVERGQQFVPTGVVLPGGKENITR